MTNISTQDMRELWVKFFKKGYSGKKTYLEREGVKYHAFTEEAWDALFKALELTGYGKASIISTYYPRLIGGGQSELGPTEAPWSLHSFSGVAIDIDPAKNPFITEEPFDWADCKFTERQVEAVKAIRTNSGAQVWRWGGDSFGDLRHDYMHWQLNCTPEDIDSGIDWSTVSKYGPPAKVFEESWKWGRSQGITSVHSDPKAPVTYERFIEMLYRMEE